MKTYDLICIGGGAAGFFSAIQAAQKNPDWNILILEKGQRVLEKVKISGGGRCNVTHACFQAEELVKFYPRGGEELLNVFSRFMCQDMIQWLEENGVPTKVEDDGRVFPRSNSSQSIISCYQNQCEKLGVEVLIGSGVEGFSFIDNSWNVETKKESLQTERLLITSGSSRKIWELLSNLGHTIETPVPSLFTFKIQDDILKELPGLSVANAIVNVHGSALKENGPLLITHQGLSGPAILKLSAWGARILSDKDYHFNIGVNWAGINKKQVEKQLKGMRESNPKGKFDSPALFGIPKRLWKKLVETCDIQAYNWAEISKKDLHKLVELIVASKYAVSGKNTNKDEFVTCGGVNLDEVDFSSMESKIHPKLYFAGEVLNIDALTGGFNFQAAWSTAWVASEGMMGSSKIKQ